MKLTQFSKIHSSATSLPIWYMGESLLLCHPSYALFKEASLIPTLRIYKNNENLFFLPSFSLLFGVILILIFVF